MNIDIINPIAYPNWDDLLNTNPETTFFHTAAWAKVLYETYWFKPLYFTAIDNGHIAGLIPVMEINSFFTGKRGVSLPFTDACDLVAQNADVFSRLFETVIIHGRKAGWKCLELRGGSRFLGNQPGSARYFSHTLALSSNEAEVKKLFKSSTRRNIRKAEKNSVSVTIEYSREAVASYYRLHCGTRRHHGLPPQPWSFFNNFFKYVISAGNGFVILAKHAGKIIAGALYTSFNDQTIYKYGASDLSFQHLRPNNLVMWEAIRWSCHNGIHSFHFGRTNPENKGLMQFKKGWGTTEEKIQYYNYDMGLSAFFKKPSKLKENYPLFKFMPLPILKLTGNLFYRHVG